MRVFTELGKTHITLWISLNVLRWTGHLVPDKLTNIQKKIQIVHAVTWFAFSAGIMTVGQAGALIQVWGNVPWMVEASYLLFAYFLYAAKITNLVVHRNGLFRLLKEGDAYLNAEVRDMGKAFIQRSNKDTIRLLYPIFVLYSAAAILGWAATEDRELLLRAWYPFDVSKSPAYELAYMQQSLSLMMVTLTIGSMDVLILSLIAVGRCRFKLLRLSLEDLFQNINRNVKHLIKPEDEEHVAGRLRVCIVNHQAALESAATMETCFTYYMLSQFTVSIVLLCVSTYQLAETDIENNLRLAFILASLLSQLAQIFLFCYQGDYLHAESLEIAQVVYETPWYICSVPLRKSFFIMMTRATRPVQLTAGGFATLSLAGFMSIVKASYSFLTVLQQVDE